VASQKNCFRIPKNLRIESMTEDNVAQVNSLWQHNYEGSDKFISYSIKYHISVGLFDETNELLAWCLRYDNGSVGILQVAKKHRRKGLGTLVSKFLCKRIAEEEDTDVLAQIVPGNVQSEQMFGKIGFKATTPHSWLVLQKKN
jgi:GNAT superfamily N-acetyltransferase